MMHRLDQHLRQRHIELGDDVGDGIHVPARGIDASKVLLLFVRNDFRLAEQLNVLLAAAGAATAPPPPPVWPRILFRRC